MSTHDLTDSSAGEVNAGRRHEVLGIVALVATLLTGLALASFDGVAALDSGATLDGGAGNWIGAFGEWLASILVRAFGVAAWVIPAELALATARCLRGRASRLGRATIASVLVFAFIGCSFLQLVFPFAHVYGDQLVGGTIGEALGEVIRSVLGTAGALIVASALLLLTIALRSPMSLAAMIGHVEALGRAIGAGMVAGAGRLLQAWRQARELEVLENEGDDEYDVDDEEGGPRIIASPGITLERRSRDEDELVGDETIEEVHTPELDSAEFEELTAEDAATPPPLPGKRGKAAKGPRIIEPKPRAESVAKAVVPEGPRGPFLLPPAHLLQKAPAEDLRIDPRVLRENAVILVEKLAAYGVKGRVDEIHPGPVVTMYEFEPESGTKVSKIAGLADDLAMALAAQKVRIVAPIPGKARVGFELPNDKRKTVYLREILEDHRWTNLDADLPMALGQDIAGQPVYADLATMPHLLVAGATGSGKSVGLNVMLASLLSRKTPEQVRLLMIDPKVVELAVFDGIPHMLLPVVTDMKKAALALRWAVDEMERRYQLFADAGARSITSFNRRVEKVIAGELAPEKLFPSRAGKVRAQNAKGEEVFLNPVDDERPDALDKPPEKLPHVVVVVDEFADLMMVAAKDVESAIARLAQKARAAGIHVILATQRPSVDVITGMIKANFPARVAFKVAQREDSKTILGRSGAEHLLGMGDMLMVPPGASDLRRVHSAFVSEDDVKAVCDFLRLQAKPIYDEAILKPRDEEDEEGGTGMPASDDPLYDRAVAIVAQAGYCSISHIQRQLSLGYNKAAKLVERMEKEGVVGPSSSKAGGRREVLIQQL